MRDNRTKPLLSPDVHWKRASGILILQCLHFDKRDQTLFRQRVIDDAIAGLKAIATGEPHFADGERTHLLYNIGHNQPVQLMDFIRTIEKATGKTARIALEPMQPGDVTETCADISKMQADYGYDPKVSLEEGIGKFVDWFKTQRVASGPSRRYM